MRVVVTGAAGQLGHDVMKRLEQLGMEGIGTDVADLDLTDREATLRQFAAWKPDAVIHCAAYTAVDKAEEDTQRCFSINVEGSRNVAMACRETGAKLLYISTDYVFDGQGVEAFEEDGDKAPINTYGLSKSLGEDACRELVQKLFIVRISWVFGLNGNNFVKTMLRLGQTRERLTVVSDQVGSPTYTRDLAVLLCEMVRADKYGIYHGTNEGYCSWCEFAQAIMEEAGLSCQVEPILSKDYPTKAQRPANSRLSKGKLDANGFARLPHWRDALVRYLEELSAQA